MGGDLGEHLGRLGMAATLANGAPFLVSKAIDWNNLVCEAIGAKSVPRGFDGSPIFDSLTTGFLVVFVLWFGLQLGLKMLYRIGLLWILIVTAPLALALLGDTPSAMDRHHLDQAVCRLDLWPGTGHHRAEAGFREQPIWRRRKPVRWGCSQRSDGRAGHRSGGSTGVPPAFLVSAFSAAPVLCTAAHAPLA